MPLPITGWPTTTSLPQKFGSLVKSFLFFKLLAMFLAASTSRCSVLTRRMVAEHVANLPLANLDCAAFGMFNPQHRGSECRSWVYFHSPARSDSSLFKSKGAYMPKNPAVECKLDLL
jgi:hypothetical protein